MRNTYFYFILFLFLFASCSEEESFLPKGSQLLLNPNLSLYPDSVFPWAPLTPNENQFGVSQEVYLSGNRSLFIESKDRSTAQTASWTQTYTGPMPAPGSTIELRAFVKGENIEDLTAGGKVSIFFRVGIPGTEGRSASSDLFLQGDFDWILFKATLEEFPKDAESIQVQLFMPDLTLGKVYFDEINLVVK